MNRERVVEEKRRLICIQKSVLKASREPHGPDVDAMIDAVAQLTLTVQALLKEHEEK